MRDEDEYDDPEADADRPPSAADRTTAWVAHPAGYFTGFLVPLVLFAVQSDRRGFVAAHVREALNFQIALMFYATLISALGAAGFFLLRAAGLQQLGLVVGLGFLAVAAFAMLLFETVVVILASVAAYNGRPYRYPLSIRLV